jgi:hypothetical protein
VVGHGGGNALDIFQRWSMHLGHADGGQFRWRSNPSWLKLCECNAVDFRSPDYII